MAAWTSKIYLQDPKKNFSMLYPLRNTITSLTCGRQKTEDSNRVTDAQMDIQVCQDSNIKTR